MKRIYEQLDDVIVMNGDDLGTLTPGSEEHKRAVDEYVSLWKVKNDIENQNRETDKEKLERELKMMTIINDEESRKRDTRWKVGAVVGCFALSTVVENFGGMRSKLSEVTRNIKIW